MQTRLARFLLLGLLSASGVAAGYLVWTGERRIEALEDRRAALDRFADRIAPAAAAIAGAQNAYTDSGLRDEATFTRVGELIDQLTAEAAALRSHDRSGNAAAHLEEFWTALSELSAARAQAQEKLALGEVLAAADLLLASTRPQTITLTAELRAFRDAEFNALRQERTRLTERSWMTLAGVAVVWLAGLLALAPLPRLSQPHIAVGIGAAPDVPTATPVVESSSPVDLAAAADLCAAILRVTDTASLPAILERAARILDARGIIIWMAAGDEMFAATAFGYDPAVMARLPPILRTAANATATAWRTAGLRTVPGDDANLGAIVAPMAGPGGCVGVLAAEVRNGRERDAATCAVTSILASQLAAILAPSASTGTAPGGPPHETSGSDRHPAAS
jgi:hypothetical protein